MKQTKHQTKSLTALNFLKSTIQLLLIIGILFSLMLSSVKAKEKGADLFIVGRAIYTARNPLEAIERYYEATKLV